jgi:hypothetical protein
MFRTENTMSPEKQFRRILPVLQTLIAILFGGWGEWHRIQMINRSLGWESTVVSHIWPWPLKLAVILNMPALLIVALIEWPINSLWPNLPEYLQLLPVILLVALLWYVIGRWLEPRSGTIDPAGNSKKLLWAMVLFFVLFCAVGAARASASSMLLYGLRAWIAAGVGMSATAIYKRLRSKRAQQA